MAHHAAAVGAAGHGHVDGAVFDGVGAVLGAAHGEAHQAARVIAFGVHRARGGQVPDHGAVADRPEGRGALDPILGVDVDVQRVPAALEAAPEGVLLGAGRNGHGHVGGQGHGLACKVHAQLQILREGRPIRGGGDGQRGRGVERPVCAVVEDEDPVMVRRAAVAAEPAVGVRSVGIVVVNLEARGVGRDLGGEHGKQLGLVAPTVAAEAFPDRDAGVLQLGVLRAVGAAPVSEMEIVAQLVAQIADHAHQDGLRRVLRRDGQSACRQQGQQQAQDREQGKDSVALHGRCLLMSISCVHGRIREGESRVRRRRGRRAPGPRYQIITNIIIIQYCAGIFNMIGAYMQTK